MLGKTAPRNRFRLRELVMGKIIHYFLICNKKYKPDRPGLSEKMCRAPRQARIQASIPNLGRGLW